MRVGDGGGGTILIDPGSLKASASKLKNAAQELSVVQSRLAGVAVPSMPAGAAGGVTDALATANDALTADPMLLESASTELTRRAFWAEFADRIMGGYTLTGADRAEFVAWMKDGTLMEYADDYDATAAGEELARVYSGFRNDPEEIIDLSACLRGAQTGVPVDLQRAFGAGFVNTFGAKNMELVPRVLQAMEYSRSIDSIGAPSDPFLLHDVAAKYEGSRLQQNPLGLLSAFSMTLANATMSGQLTRRTEDEIEDDPDAWATAALVSTGVFSTPFLLKVFKNDVVDKISSDSRYDRLGGLAQPPQDDPYPLGRLYTEGKGGLPADPKEIILDALSRNGDAAMHALTDPLHNVQVWDRYGQESTVTNPLDLLYQHGHFDDSGSALGRAYAAAADQMNSVPDDKLAAAQLTQHALGLMLGDDNGMNGFKDGLATDLAHNHISDLFDAAQWSDPGGSNHIQILGGHVIPSTDAMIHMFDSLGGQPSALQTLLHAAAAEQAKIVFAGAAAGPNGDTVWAHKVSAFDAQALAGADLQRFENFDATDTRHDLIVGFVKNIVDDTVDIGNPILGAAAHSGIDAAIQSAFPGPDAEKVIFENFDARVFIQNSLHAQIASAFQAHGYLSAPKPLLNDGRLISYASTSGPQRLAYESWLNGNGKVDVVTRNAYNEIDRAFNENGVDLFR
jgi:hypothetical protein